MNAETNRPRPDAPIEPLQSSLTVVYEKTVVLVRHHFSDKGDIGEIFNEYINGKIG